MGGFFLARLFGYQFGSAVFVGTAMTATSIAITANVLKEMGKLQTDAAKAVIGAAVIDDVLSLLALSISQQLVSGSFSLTTILLVFAKAAAFLAIGTYIGYRFLSRLIEKVDATKLAKKFPEFVFIFAMMLAFLYAMFAEIIQLSAIIGAFIAGVSLESAKIVHGRNYKEGAEYLHIIFASVFFVSLGIIADLYAVTWGVVAFLGVLTVVAVLSKVVGCYIPARLQGMSHLDAAIVGFGMSPRGEVAMIVALIGLSAGLINQDIYVSIVITSLLTTILTPIVLRNWLYKKVQDS
jgi:Kef-type K+ transport system membrane component KefB